MEENKAAYDQPSQMNPTLNAKFDPRALPKVQISRILLGHFTNV